MQLQNETIKERTPIKGLLIDWLIIFGTYLFIDKNMKRIEMQHLTGISANILARMGKNQYVSMETVEKICKKMDCTIDEMMEFTD